MDPPYCESHIVKNYSPATMLTTRRPRAVPNSTTTRLKCKECVVFATTNVCTGVEVGPALANNDFAGIDFLAAEALHAEALGVAVATVSGAGCTFLMCHGSLPCRNIGDLHLGQFRAMALATTVAGLVLELQNINFHTAMMVDDLSCDLDLGKCRRITGHFAVFNEEHCWNSYVVPGFPGNPVNNHEVAYCDLLLPSAGLNYGVHHDTPVSYVQLTSSIVRW